MAGSESRISQGNSNFLSFRVSRLAAIIVTAVVILTLTAFGFDPRFAHICGYGLGIVLYLGLSDEDHRATANISVIAIAYALSLVGISILAARMGLNAYVAHVLSAGIFAAAVFCIPVAASKLAGITRTHPSLLPLLRRWAGAGLALGFVALSALAVYGVVSFARSVDERAAVQVSHRVHSWLDTASCFVKSGKILTACPENGGLVALEDVGLADDRGHSLLLSFSARWFGAPIDKRSVAYINFAVTVAGIGLLGWQLIRVGFPIAGAIVLLGALIVPISPIVGADAPGAYYALFALALVLPLQLLRMLALQRIGWNDWAWLGLAAFALSFVSVMRQPFGLIGVVMVIVALVLRMDVLLTKHLSRTRFAVVACAAASAYVAMHATDLLIAVRSVWQGIPPGEGSSTHGIAHNLYLGLGAEPNSFGIEYDDNHGVAAVKRVDPSIEYGSKAYYSVIMKLYFQIVWTHPMEVAKIYAVKIGKTFGPLLLALPLALAGLICLVSSLSCPADRARPGAVGAPPVAVCVMVLMILNSMQGVLTVPSGNNFPSLIGIAVLFALVVDIGFAAVRGRST